MHNNSTYRDGSCTRSLRLIPLRSSARFLKQLSLTMVWDGEGRKQKESKIHICMYCLKDLALQPCLRLMYTNYLQAYKVKAINAISFILYPSRVIPVPDSCKYLANFCFHYATHGAYICVRNEQPAKILRLCLSHEYYYTVTSNDTTLG